MTTWQEDQDRTVCVNFAVQLFVWCMGPIRHHPNMFGKRDSGHSQCSGSFPVNSATLNSSTFGAVDPSFDGEISPVLQEQLPSMISAEDVTERHDMELQ